MLLNSKCTTPHLREACKSFVRRNGTLLRSDEKFRLEIEESPALGLLLFDAWQDEIEDDATGKGYKESSSATSSLKRRRISEPDHTHELVPDVTPTNTIASNTISSSNGSSGVDSW
jgi:hypothetical protein